MNRTIRSLLTRDMSSFVWNEWLTFSYYINILFPTNEQKKWNVYSRNRMKIFSVVDARKWESIVQTRTYAVANELLLHEHHRYIYILYGYKNIASAANKPYESMRENHGNSCVFFFNSLSLSLSSHLAFGIHIHFISFSFAA